MVKTYNPKDLIIIFGGVVVSGFADGTFVTVTPNSERFTRTVGADGEVGRAKSNDNTHEVVITLMSTSASNDYLSIVLNADKSLNAGVKPLQIIDNKGTTLFFWDAAWIVQPPDVEFSKEITERAWTLHTGQVVEENIGGSTVSIAV